MNYTTLHNHTEYSNALLGFPDSVNKLEEFIQNAYDIGLNGISITEHEGITSHVQAIKYYKSMEKDRDFKLIFGNEIYLLFEQEDIDNQDKEIDSYTPYYHFLLNALDSQGHEQLRELSSLAWLRAYMYKGLMRRPTYFTDIQDIIGDNKGHLVASTACLGGRLSKLILQWKESGDDSYKEKIHKFLSWGISTFGRDYFYLEIQPCLENNEEQITVNGTMKMLANVYSLKIICTTDSHYLSKDKAFIHKTLLNSKDGDREVDDFYSTAYLMDSDELRKYFQPYFTNEEIDQFYTNTNEICDRVQFYDFEHAPMIPQIPKDKLPLFKIRHRYKEYYDKYIEFKYYAYAPNILDQYFFSQIENALYNMIELKGKDIETYINRLNDEFRELHLISDAFNDSMASYYTSVSKIIELIWEADSLSMPARGSGAGFLVSYLLEITQIDPVPLGDYFPFWRHLSAERGIEIADIDNDSQASKKEDIVEAIRDYWGDDRVLNVATTSSLTSKTSIERACKGLGLNDDLAGYLKSLIPVERGAIWSLKDCIEGNKEKGRKKVTELINELESYEHLKECALAFEGLIIGRGVHPAGVLIGNEPYTKTIACMRSPKGVLCSCYDLHDAEYCGQTKVDMLTIISSDKIRKTMDLLIEYGHMEYQGSLKKTYWKYLHPDVLEYDEPKMWELIRSIYSVFQFDTPVSVKALNQTHPKSVMDLSATNSLLRLMAQDGQMPPIEKYALYKQDINNWYKDMTDFGLNQEEQDCLKDYLIDAYGLADSQEKVMRLSMDKRTSGFTLKQANKLRKSIAKKNPKVLEETKELFFKSCKDIGTRDIFADYIWNVVFAMSFGYSFSQLHSYSYSIIALQQLNLNYFYPPVYWNTACLTVESSTDEDNEKNRRTNYGKVAKAIYKMAKHDVIILPPDINQSGVSFTPNEQNNTILFGLGGISGINQDIAREIVEGRPYTSFKQFYDYHKNLQVLDGVDQDGGKLYRGSLLTKSKFIKLIQAGCFDTFNTNRIALMKWLCVYEHPKKESLNMQNMAQCIELNVNLPFELVRTYKFKQYVLSKEYLYCQDPKFKSKKHYICEPKFARPYLEKHYINSMKEEIDYYYVDDMLIIVDKSLEKAMKKDLDGLKECLSSQDVLNDFNTKMLQKQYIDMVKVEDVDKWSMDSTSFYHNGRHELDGVNLSKYNITSFNKLPEEPRFIEKMSKNKKRKWKQYDISRICGTVLDRNDQNHLVDILTPDLDVVTLNIPQGQFGFYKQTISEMVNDKKVVMDDNWLKRGNIILVSGYRRDDAFFVKKYANSIYQHSIVLVDKINEDGTLDLKLERYGIDKDE